MNEEEIDLYGVIEDAFKQIDRLKIAHCVQHTYKLYNNIK